MEGEWWVRATHLLWGSGGLMKDESCLWVLPKGLLEVAGPYLAAAVKDTLSFIAFLTDGWQVINSMCRLWFRNCWLSTPSSMKKDPSLACSETGRNQGVTSWEPGMWPFRLPTSLTRCLILEPEYTGSCHGTTHSCLNFKYWCKRENQQEPTV